MSKIEVDEASFVASNKLRQTVQAMLSHPTVGPKLRAAHTEFDPNVKYPELEAKKATDEGIATLTKTVHDFIEAQKEERKKEREESQNAAFRERFEEGRNRLRSLGVMDKGLNAVEDFMQKNGIVDHDVAWAAFSKLHPEAEPVSPTANYGMSGVLAGEAQGSEKTDAYIKALHEGRGHAPQAQDKFIAEILAEVRSQNPLAQHNPRFGGR